MSIQTKILLVLLPLALLLSRGVGTFTRGQARHAFEEEIHSIVETSFRPGMPHFEPLLQGGKEKQLRAALEELRDQRHALYVYALESDGDVVDSVFSESGGSTVLNYSGNRFFQKALSGGQAAEEFLDKGTPPTVDVWLPITAEAGGKPVGALRVGFPLANLLHTESGLVNNMERGLFVLLGCCMVIFLLFLRHLLKPVELLTNATHRLADGDWGVTVPVTSDDELGKLTLTFNTMSVELRDTAGFLEAIVHQMVDALIVARPDGSIRLINPAALRLTGHVSKEVNGHPLDSLFPADQRAAFKPVQFERTFSAQTSRGMESTLLRRDGSGVPVSLSGSVLRDKEGMVTGFVLMARDITDFKKWEQGLLEAREAALESARLKSEFLANMSHEIRTPMNAIIGMAGLLLGTRLDAEQTEYAETIRKSGDALLALINDILDFSKIEAGKMEIEVTDFEPRVVLEEVMDLLAETAHEKDLELNYWLDEAVPATAKGDPTRLRQILTNLVGNALKFTEKGEVNVWAEPVGVPDALGEIYLRFNVKDTGIGIPQDRQNRLFKSFSQVDGSNTRRYGGTGLGLAISKQLSELMGGTIGVESAPGEGSRFWFTVKLSPSAMSPGGVVPRGDLKGLRALIVDDNATNRRILTLQTKAWEMQSNEVPDGASALEALRRAVDEGQPYQLALLDMQMPEMDGLELTRLIKANSALRDTRLVMLTSMGHPGHVWAAREAGVVAYLTKPVKQSALYNCLLGVMSGVESCPAGPFSAEDNLPTFQATEARILLVEDNIINQKVAQMQLQKFGFTPDVARDGMEALEKIAKGDYHLVLMDCQMPRMDGFEATRELRRREKNSSRHTPVVAMTANAMKGDKERCLEAGMDDYISKPVHLRALAQMLQRWISPKLNLPGEEEAASSPEVSAPIAPPAAAAALPPEALDLPLVSPEGIEKLRSLDTDGGNFVKEVIQLFLEDTPPRLTNLRKAVVEKDLHQMEHEAHTLKGSSGNLGAARMRATSILLVDLARSGKAEGALPLVDRIEKQYAQTVEELRPLLGETPPGA